MPSPSERLIAAYLTRHNRLRAQTGVAVGRMWDRYAHPDDDDGFAERAAMLSLAGQNATAAAVAGYLAALLLALGEEAQPAPTDLEIPTRAGVEPAAVYQRSIVTVRTALSVGRSLAEAMAAGRARAVSTAETDVALAQRAATVQVLNADDRVVGYRRVLTGQSCALCRIASTQRYRTDELMPIHNHCDCGVAPIIGNRDPGRVINKPLLAELKKQGEIDKITRQRQIPKAEESLDNAKTRVEELRQEIRAETDQERETRLERRLDKWQQEVKRREKRVEMLRAERSQPKPAVHEHGELGPVLTDDAHDFTAESDLAA